MDDVTVVRMLFARSLGQIEPEAMNPLNIFLYEVGCVRPEQKPVRLPLWIHDPEAELPPRVVGQLLPGPTEAPGLLRWRHHGGEPGDDLDGLQFHGREHNRLKDVR